MSYERQVVKPVFLNSVFLVLAACSSPTLVYAQADTVSLAERLGAKFRGKSQVRNLGRGEEAAQFSTDAVGNVYKVGRGSSDINDELLVLQPGTSTWRFTGVKLSEPSGTQTIIDPELRSISPLSGLTGGGNTAGFFYTTTDDLSPLTIYCTYLGSRDFFGPTCQLFRGRSGQILLTRDTGDVVVSDSSGVHWTPKGNLGGQRATIGSPARRVYAGPSQVYASDKDSGDIYKYTENGGWSWFSHRAHSFVVSHDGVPFKSDQSGVYRYFDLVGWRKIGDGLGAFGSSLVVGNSTDLYMHDGDGGPLYRYSGFPGEWDYFYGPVVRDPVANKNDVIFRDGRPYGQSSLLSISHPRVQLTEGEVVASAPTTGVVASLFLVLGLFGFGFFGATGNRFAVIR